MGAKLKEGCFLKLRSCLQNTFEYKDCFSKIFAIVKHRGVPNKKKILFSLLPDTEQDTRWIRYKFAEGPLGIPQKGCAGAGWRDVLTEFQLSFCTPHVGKATRRGYTAAMPKNIHYLGAQIMVGVKGEEFVQGEHCLEIKVVLLFLTR